MNNDLNHLNIEITKHCNQKCLYCFNNSGPWGAKAKFSLEEWKTFLATLKKQTNLQSIHVTGGEPFTYPHIIELIDFAVSIGLSVSILSNGFKISDLCEKHPEIMGHLTTAQISLDSMDSNYVNDMRRYDNAYFDAISAIKSLRRLEVPVEISSVYNPRISKSEYDKLMLFANKNGCNIIMRSLERTGRGKSFSRKINIDFEINESEITDRYYYLPSERDVGVNRGVRTILSEGEVVPQAIQLNHQSINNINVIF